MSSEAAGIFVAPFLSAPLEVHLGSAATAGMGPVGGGWGAGDARTDFSKHDSMTARKDSEKKGFRSQEEIQTVDRQCYS